MVGWLPGGRSAGPSVVPLLCVVCSPVGNHVYVCVCVLVSWLTSLLVSVVWAARDLR